ncbi:hypothetical protein [Vibrio sp. R78045]|uniref:hypothetical protein n=1 Tax=Vibrio sp. R78045 TaxID=3093868 RepID=UPI0036F29BF9
MSDFGEIVECYTKTAVIQLQRIPKAAKNVVTQNVNVTIAPLMRQGGSLRTADYSQKLTIQLVESDLANFAIALMGLRSSTEIKGSDVGNYSKVLYVNVNEDQTTNIIISFYSKGNTTNSNVSQSITFKNSERYPLLRLVVTQLTKNSTQYEQTVADTLNLLKASVLRP